MVEDLIQIIGDPERLSTNATVRQQHSQDLTSYHAQHLPDVVIYPKDREELREIVAYANRTRCPIVPFGLGTSVEGQVVPVKGGISLNFTHMNRILEIRKDDFAVRVEPGVTRLQLNQALKKYGLFFPIDPGVDATLGGMAATNASGCSAVRYGTTREQILGMEAVLADGSFMRTGSLAKKSSAGYNLTQLLAGSEGTLAVITELTLRVYAMPETFLYAKVVFPDLHKVCKAANQMLYRSIRPSKLELVDEYTIQAINSYTQTTYMEKPTLFLELSGWKSTVAADWERVYEIIRDEAAIEWNYTFDEAYGQQLWDSRRQAALAIAAAAPGKKLMTTDVCVPLSVLPEAVSYAREAMQAEDLQGAILGHIGDGNYHAVFPIDLSLPEEVAKADKINGLIVRFALERGGTCTGEHGVGLGKRQYLTEEHGDAVMWMKRIKELFDPSDILNPGKIF
ncbi:D-lactate dehydrogenase (cytochrome) [Paenibacillus sp. UNC496MF]|uniref:FAD-binding oxidoreductase n=1 Tax=Paenibacillus sp. UNC496MF TaxID=1502753 RepID=UPI0008ECA92A|nr:FAD-linked oxidase C-terminal domain-containing protein [Paenibacillus sp. UNC496MF]SFJ55878.1 D-lactate dehydrogenase (cytochrome) [Paenibacillus sp. UNC496MF]